MLGEVRGARGVLEQAPKKAAVKKSEKAFSLRTIDILSEFPAFALGHCGIPCYHTCMARKKISTTVYLTEEQVVALKELHARTRVPIAEYIREGIDMILQKHAHQLPGQTSLFEEFAGEALGSKRKESSTE